MNRFERVLVRWSSWATGLTGLVYLWMKHFLTPEEPWAAVNHPLQPWALKAHILVAPVFVFAFGLVAVGHVWKHWRRGVASGRRSGILLMLVVGPMVMTGYLIQVLVHPVWLAVVAWSHIGLGVVFLGAFVVHAVVFFREEAVTRPGRDGVPVGGGTASGERTADADRGRGSRTPIRGGGRRTEGGGPTFRP